MLRLSAITLLLGATISMLATPTISLPFVTGGMDLDNYGAVQIEPNGTIFSFDHNNTVIHSKQLTGEEFTALTGCNMVTPGMPPSADLETEQCLQNYTIPKKPNSGVSAKRDSNVFERDLTCAAYLCVFNYECQRLTGIVCRACIKTPFSQRYGICSPV
ncbi:hypothetical protein V8E54_003887 [Elaphomyces granulatus]